jgi:hypothetical protein
MTYVSESHTLGKAKAPKRKFRLVELKPHNGF